MSIVNLYITFSIFWMAEKLIPLDLIKRHGNCCIGQPYCFYTYLLEASNACITWASSNPTVRYGNSAKWSLITFYFLCLPIVICLWMMKDSGWILINFIFSRGSSYGQHCKLSTIEIRFLIKDSSFYESINVFGFKNYALLLRTDST